MTSHEAQALRIRPVHSPQLQGRTTPYYPPLGTNTSSHGSSLQDLGPAATPGSELLWPRRLTSVSGAVGAASGSVTWPLWVGGVRSRKGLRLRPVTGRRVEVAGCETANTREGRGELRLATEAGRLMSVRPFSLPLRVFYPLPWIPVTWTLRVGVRRLGFITVAPLIGSLGIRQDTFFHGFQPPYLEAGGFIQSDCELMGRNWLFINVTLSCPWYRTRIV